MKRPSMEPGRACCRGGQGRRVLACENTLRGQKLTRDDMMPAIRYVPAGVTEIMKKQGERWAYRQSATPA